MDKLKLKPSPLKIPWDGFMAAGMTHLKGADHNDRGSFDILAEQKILVICETKWYEIGLRPEG
jgi:hypothetical protein